MGDELKALLDAVSKLQPLLADPLHFAHLKSVVHHMNLKLCISLAGEKTASCALVGLREQVERITSLVDVQLTSNPQVAGVEAWAHSTRRTGEIGNSFISLASRNQSTNLLRPKGESFEGSGVFFEGFQPTLKGGKAAAQVTTPMTGAQQLSTSGSRPVREQHGARAPSLAGPEPPASSEGQGAGTYNEPLTSLPGAQPPQAPNSQLAWEQVERVTNLARPHSATDIHASWEHVERVAFMGGAQPASNTRTTKATQAAADKGNTQNCDARPISETQGLDGECTENGPPDGKSNGRAYKAGKWSPTETLTLVYCKRGHFLKYGPLNHRRNIGVSAAERWIEMEDEMLRRNVMRSKSQCQEKWEQLASDFKKVYDHQQNHVPLGEPSYFQMTQAERKEHMLRFPKANLDETVYNALCEWYPRNSVGMDPGDLPSDSPFDLAAMSRGGHINDPPALEDNRPALDDGTGDSSSPNSTKRRRLSTKASEGAFSAVENNRKESSNAVTTVSVEQDRKDARHRQTLEMDAKKHRELLELEARKHQDKIIIEKEKLQRSAALGQGYIAALSSIADGLKVIGDALKKP